MKLYHMLFGWESDEVIATYQRFLWLNDAQQKTRSMSQYGMIIQWSDEDRLFLTTIPEFVDLVVMPCTHGKTRDEAIRNGEEVIKMYLEAWQAEGESIPQSRTLQVV